MKDYLSSSDRDEFVCFMHMMNNSRNMLEKGKTYTKEEITNLKKAFTWGNKALDSVMDRLNPSAKRALANMISSTRAFLDYKTLTSVYAERKMAELDAAYEENADYFKLVELIMHYNCRGCTNCHNDCEFYKEFEDKYIPNFDGLKPYGECKYSFIKED